MDTAGSFNFPSSMVNTDEQTNNDLPLNFFQQFIFGKRRQTLRRPLIRRLAEPLSAIRSAKLTYLHAATSRRKKCRVDQHC